MLISWQLRQVKKYQSTIAVAKMLGIDFERFDVSYDWDLSAEQIPERKPLNEQFGKCGINLFTCSSLKNTQIPLSSISQDVIILCPGLYSIYLS